MTPSTKKVVLSQINVENIENGIFIIYIFNIFIPGETKLKHGRSTSSGSVTGDQNK